MRSLIVAIALPVLIVAAVLAVPNSHAQVRRTPVAQPSWEYDVVDVVKTLGGTGDRDRTGASFEKQLNSLGNDGWELCHEVHGYMVFKRKK